MPSNLLAVVAVTLMSLTAFSHSARADGPPIRIACSHPFSDEHPLVTGFLAPWANGITTDAKGELRIDVVAQAVPSESCSLAPLDTDLGGAVSLPFAMSVDAVRASKILFWAAEDTEPGMLAAVALPHDVLSVNSLSGPPLPGSLEGLAFAPPTPQIGAILSNLGATVEGLPAARPTAVLASLGAMAETDWVLTFDAGVSLYTEPLILRVSPEQIEALPASLRALLRQIPGIELSAAAGRALNRARAVVLEDLNARAMQVSLIEDLVGMTLDQASALHAAWADGSEDHLQALNALYDAHRRAGDPGYLLPRD